MNVKKLDEQFKAQKESEEKRKKLAEDMKKGLERICKHEDAYILFKWLYHICEVNRSTMHYTQQGELDQIGSLIHSSKKDVYLSLRPYLPNELKIKVEIE